MSPSKMSIVFAGTPDFAVPSLKALIADDAFDVKLVISQPDKPVGRSQEVLPTPVKKAALDAGIPVEQPENINTFQHFNISTFQFLVTVAYGQILKQPILDLPEVAPVNLHASLLPHWRGASPMQSAILNGDRQTGVTIQRMVKELDAGPILAQESLALHGTETITQLHDSLAAMGARLLVETVKKPLTETPQDETKATFCRKLTKDMGTFDPKRMTAQEIDRHVRALVPWPGVRTKLHNEDVKLIEVSLEEKEGSVPLQCKDSVLHLVTVQPAGKKPMSADAWERGRK